MADSNRIKMLGWISLLANVWTSRWRQTLYRWTWQVDEYWLRIWGWLMDGGVGSVDSWIWSAIGSRAADQVWSHVGLQTVLGFWWPGLVWMAGCQIFGPHAWGVLQNRVRKQGKGEGKHHHIILKKFFFLFYSTLQNFFFRIWFIKSFSQSKEKLLRLHGH